MSLYHEKVNFDPDLKYSGGVCHCFVQEQSEKFITLETQRKWIISLCLISIMSLIMFEYYHSITYITNLGLYTIIQRIKKVIINLNV